jgi:branched-chain amino acid transport system ATP-binding protein
MNTSTTSALAADRLTIEFGGIKAVSDVSFAAKPGEIFAIIGPNGAGKTTLFNLLSGIYVPRGGRVMLDGNDVTGEAPHRLAQRGLSRTFQNLQIFLRMSAAENVMVGRHLHEQRNVFVHLLALPSVWRQNKETRRQAESLLERVGLGGLSSRPAGALPYGALKRLEIARALATEPKVLLLDEPAAGCNAVETRELEAIIRGIARDGIAVVLVEHDMRLVMDLSDRIHVLASGRTLAEGTAAEVRTNPAVIEAYLGVHGAPKTASEAAHAGD